MTRQERINAHKKQDRIPSIKQAFKDDVASLAGKVNEILLALKDAGIVK